MMSSSAVITQFSHTKKNRFMQVQLLEYSSFLHFLSHYQAHMLGFQKEFSRHICCFNSFLHLHRLLLLFHFCFQFYLLPSNLHLQSHRTYY